MKIQDGMYVLQEEKEEENIFNAWKCGEVRLHMPKSVTDWHFTKWVSGSQSK